MKSTLRSLAFLLAGLVVLMAAPTLASAGGGSATPVDPVSPTSDAPSAIDQYLEVVPGPDGAQTPEEFSRSLGGDGGPVTREQVIRAARENAAVRAREAAQGRLSPNSGISYSTDENAPSTLAAFTNAATGGSVGNGLGMPLLAIVLLTAALGVVLRRSRVA